MPQPNILRELNATLYLQIIQNQEQVLTKPISNSKLF